MVELEIIKEQYGDTSCIEEAAQARVELTYVRIRKEINNTHKHDGWAVVNNRTESRQSSESHQEVKRRVHPHRRIVDVDHKLHDRPHHWKRSLKK